MAIYEIVRDRLVARATELSADILVRPQGETWYDVFHKSGLDEKGKITVRPMDGHDKAIIERAGLESEGTKGHRIQIRKVSGDSILTDACDQMLRRIAALQARERTVLPYATRTRPYPAWSFTIHRIARLLLENAGVDLTTVPLSRYGRAMEGPGRPIGIGAASTWGASREQYHVGGGEIDASAKNCHVICKPTMYGVKAMVSHMAVGYGNAHVVLVETRTGIEMRIKGDLPESAVNALKGMDVGQAVGHDAFDGQTGVEIVKARRTDKHLLLTLRDVRDPVAPAPDDVDVSWLTAENG